MDDNTINWFFPLGYNIGYSAKGTYLIQNAIPRDDDDGKLTLSFNGKFVGRFIGTDDAIEAATNHFKELPAAPDAQTTRAVRSYPSSKEQPNSQKGY